MINNKVGLIGGGNMARAIGGGLLRGGMHATDLMIAEPIAEQCERLREELYGAMVTQDNRLVAGNRGLYVCGFGWDGIGINDMTKSSRQIASAIAAGITAKGETEVKGVYF